MSTVRAKIDAFVAYSGGEVRLSNDDWPDDHPVVLERPELFETPEPVKRGPGRPAGARNKSKTEE